MSEEIDVPQEYLGTFRRLMRLAPEALRNNRRFQESTLMYLRLGGEKLARQNLEIHRKPFREELFTVKKRPADENLEEDLQESPEESEEEEEEDL